MSRPQRIQPRTLRGFRDVTPDQMIRKEAMLDTIRGVFRRFGFLPIDTPALEYAEILLAKAGGETAQQVYRFDDQGGRDVALRFDLTVPLARFVATHVQKLGTPFKRYHMGPVWRGENTARGRFREFWQCDFDLVGTTSPLADLETVLVAHALLAELAVGPFAIHVSDRTLLSALLDQLGLGERYLEVLRAIDKLAKIGREGVERELVDTAGLEPAAVAAVFDFVELGGEPAAIIETLRGRLGGSEAAAAGLDRLALVFDGIAAAGVPPAAVRLDLSIARGLDYYTGLVMETFLTDHPGLGSVCSGGRYDDLASLYTSQKLPGTGASLGLDRLMDAIERRDEGEERPPSADVLVLVLDDGLRLEAVRMATELRQAGISTELYLEPRKIQKQLQYADRRGIRAAVIVGPDEAAAGTVSVKNLASAEQRDGIPRADLVAAVRGSLG
jgi:histidyl-tRNA synthetase